METCDDTIIEDDAPPVLIPLRRPTHELLAMRNTWEQWWADYINAQRRGDPEPAALMSSRDFFLWMFTASDADVCDSYEKWGRTPERHIQVEYARMAAEAEAEAA